MANVDICKKHGHSQREALKQRIIKGKSRKTIQITKSSDMNLVLKTAAGFNKLSLEEIQNQFKGTNDWKVIASGAVHSIPITEFRFKNLPRVAADGSIDFASHVKKNTRGDIGGFTMDETDSRLKEEFMNRYNELLQSGKSELEAKTAIKKDTEFTAFTQWLDEKAEMDVAESLRKAMHNLRIPCFIARSVKQEDFANEKEKPYMSNLTAFRNLGLKNLPDTATEADILVAYVWGDSIRIALTEVKNITQYPWGSAELPDRQNNSKAISQLEKDLKLFDSLLEDLPADKLSFQLFSAFPSCKQEDLEKIFCSMCMKSVINQNDTSSPANMVNKLEVDGPIPTATDEGKELLLTLVSRLTGQASKLHLMNRLTTDKARREKARHETNVDLVDQKILTHHQYVILSDKQKQIVNQVHQSPHFTIRGRAGSGKTLLCIALARAMAAKDKNTVLIMTSGMGGMTKSAPTMTHMANQVKPGKAGGGGGIGIGKAGGGGGIFNSMKKLFGLNFDQTDQITNKVIIEDMENVLQLLNMDINSFQMSPGRYNYPALLTALAQSAVQEYGNVVIAVDELRPMDAPDKQVGGTTHRDWTALGQIKGQVRIVLAFNPESFYPILLPDDQSFCHVESELRYRSTISITKMVDMMAVHTRRDKCVVTQDTAASDVAGSLPYVKDLGRFNTDLVETAVSMIKQSMTDQQNNTAITLLYGVRFSDKMKDKIRDLGTLYGWPVYDVNQFAGWEEESIIYVGPGQMEALSRAKLHLFVLLGYEEEKYKGRYKMFRDGFVQAETEGLVKMGN